MITEFDLEDDAKPGWRITRARFVVQAGCAVVAIAAMSLIARETRPPSVQNSVPDRAGSSSLIAEVGSAASKDAAPVSDDPSSLAAGRGQPVRLDPAAASREKDLTRGAFPAIDAPYLHLVVTEGPVDRSPALFVTMARRAADGRGLFIARSGERGLVDTRFGPVETLEATLTMLSNAGTSRVCTGFATRPPAAVRIDGWLCAPLGLAPEPRAIACALDKLPGNSQALPYRAEIEAIEAVPQAKTRSASDCSPGPDVAGQTGSIDRPSNRRKTRVRRSTQAWP